MMEPRLPFSSKWTPIPKELAHQITEVFEETFSSYLKKGRICTEGRIYLREVLLRVGYWEKGRLKQNNFQVSIEYNRDKDNMVKMIHLGVDCIASLLEQFFAAPKEEDFPHTWTRFEVEGREVFLQYNTENSELEAAADEILGEGEEGLLRGENEDEELEAKISLLGVGNKDSSEEDQQTSKKKKTKKATTKKNSHH